MKPSVPSEHTRSVWMSVDMPTSAALNEDTATEVCIIGGGIAGLTTAYRLLQEGKSVVVLESGTLGSGLTSLTTAHLSHVMDRGSSTIERLHGEQGARSAYRVTQQRSNGSKRLPPKNPSHATSNGWTGICSLPPPAPHAESKKNGKPLVASGRPMWLDTIQHRRFLSPRAPIYDSHVKLNFIR